MTGSQCFYAIIVVRHRGERLTVEACFYLSSEFLKSEFCAANDSS